MEPSFFVVESHEDRGENKNPLLENKTQFCVGSHEGIENITLGGWNLVVVFSKSRRWRRKPRKNKTHFCVGGHEDIEKKTLEK